MKKILCLLALSVVTASSAFSQSPVGKWKKTAHISVYEGRKMDTHVALLQQRPCAADIVYEVNADATFRLNAKESGCDEKYKNIQEKLYSKTKWKLEGNKIMISATNFAVGQSYIITISGSKMTWVGTEGQGTIIYQKK